MQQNSYDQGDLFLRVGVLQERMRQLQGRMKGLERELQAMKAKAQRLAILAALWLLAIVSNLETEHLAELAAAAVRAGLKAL